MELVEEAICDAAEATESRMKTGYASEEASSARSSEGITRDEFLELFKAGVREILPESYRLSGKNSAGYGPRRDADIESLKKTRANPPKEALQTM